MARPGRAESGETAECVESARMHLGRRGRYPGPFRSSRSAHSHPRANLPVSCPTFRSHGISSPCRMRLISVSLPCVQQSMPSASSRGRKTVGGPIDVLVIKPKEAYRVQRKELGMAEAAAISEWARQFRISNCLWPIPRLRVTEKPPADRPCGFCYCCDYRLLTIDRVP